MEWKGVSGTFEGKIGSFSVNTRLKGEYKIYGKVSN
jgi:hypothetical protein